MLPQLEWVEELKDSVNRATGGQVKSIEVVDVTDPLKKKVLFHLHEELTPQDYHPFCHLAQGFAQANGCVLERVIRTGHSLILEILLRHRLGPPMRKNPLNEDKGPSVRGG